MTKPIRRVNWQLGGVVPDRPLQTEAMIVPRAIHRLGNRILWPDWAGSKAVRPGAGMLFQFVELSGKADKDILRYARTWGVLALCEHGLPRHHTVADRTSPATLPPGAWGAGSRTSWCCPRVAKVGFEGRTIHFDHIEDWRRYSRIAQSILNIAAELNQGRAAQDEDWRALAPLADADLLASGFGYPFIRGGQRSMRAQRNALAYVINEWLQSAGVTIWFGWDCNADQWQISLGTSGDDDNLLGHLGYALLIAASQSDGLAICCNCRRSYVPERRPNPNRRNYCPTCGNRAAWRDAARAKRTRAG